VQSRVRSSIALWCAALWLSGPAFGGLKEGLEAFDRDNALAFRELRPLAEKGNPIAQYNIGLMYMRGLGVQKNPSVAVQWFEKSAAQGYARGELNLGVAYRIGLGVQQDTQRALQLFRQAAAKRDAAAELNLADMYSRGEGVAANPVEALMWYRRAAEKERPYAEYRIGLHYYDGRAVPQDYAQASVWITRAAEQGYGPAMMVLGGMYDSGNGVRVDPVASCFWFRAAQSRELADGDLDKAKALASQVCKKLPASGLAEVDARIAAWKPNERYRKREAEEMQLLLRQAAESDRREREVQSK
jgi:TPR repeat protein